MIGDPLAEFTVRQGFQWAMLNFYTFTLVMMRMSGLMTIGPLFGQPVVPANIRVLIVVSISILVTPTLDNHARLAFRQLDVNEDGRLVRDEVPEHLHDRFDVLLQTYGAPEEFGLTIDQYHYTVEMPTSIAGYGRLILGEFALGFVLGLGVLIVLSGLQMAGQLVDQQSGIAIGDVVNPGLDMSGSISGQHLYLLGVVVFLVMTPADGAPMNGHLHIVSALVETFQTLPVGEATISVSSIHLLRDLVHQSLVLAVLVAAPLLAVMSLVALAMGFLGHTVPQINVLIVGFPIRAMVSLFVLAISMSSVGRLVVDMVPRAIDGLQAALRL
jgi:flagellar biosynthesis protein FliR